MPIKIDCGDVELSLNLVFGMTYRLTSTSDEERDARDAMMAKVMEMKPHLEKTVLEQIGEHIGYDQETITTKVKARDEKNAADRKAEDDGRAVKSAQRAGLPPPTSPPPIEQGFPVVPEDSE